MCSVHLTYRDKRVDHGNRMWLQSYVTFTLTAVAFRCLFFPGEVVLWGDLVGFFFLILLE